jgi:hypothetical protein
MNCHSLQLDLLQPLFESATNAAQKGQAQYFTPVNFAKEIAVHLPESRKTVCDLTCGNGSLLTGTANESTRHLLGCDIEKLAIKNSRFATTNFQADLTLLYPLLKEIEWRCDLFALNPPWDLHWHRERLKALAQSKVPAVRAASASRDPRLSTQTIDSTIATLLIALDRCTYRGEGVLIANASTVQRLIFALDAPHRALAQHIWAQTVIDGNPCLRNPKPIHEIDHESVSPSISPRFQTSVLYFALDHNSGPQLRHQPLESISRSKREGSSVAGEWQAYEKSQKIWRAAGEEYKIRHSPDPPPWNLSLSRDGTIRVFLSVFDQERKTADGEAAQRLFNLRGKHPMQLVLQRATRRELLNELAYEVWKVDPALRSAVETAIRDYHAARAPLYPLPKTQRLGYLDEEDTIDCERNLDHPSHRRVGLFRAGRRYSLRSETVPILRYTRRRNLEGKWEDLQLTGRELAFFIRAEDNQEYCFFTDLSLAPQNLSSQFHVFDLQTLFNHFHFPEVPDVASINTARYEQYKDRLSDIEAVLAA